MLKDFVPARLLEALVPLLVPENGHADQLVGDHQGLQNYIDLDLRVAEHLHLHTCIR